MKDIAIIGVAGRFPEADNLAGFRRQLIRGKDGVRELSAQRKSATSLPMEKDFMIAGYIEGVEYFDHKFFTISRAEAEQMDPHQRLSLEVVYETIDSAGYSMETLDGTATAIFIGDTEQEYYRLADRFDPTLVTGNTSATTAGRIARFFNFRGNAAMVDTACSSSLLAVHLACNELTLGDAEYALACGIRLILFPEEKNSNNRMDILSADGKTRSFSAAADGSGTGEAVGSVLLKPLDKALADKDIIYAVIKGTAVNQDARLSGSLTAPSSQAQAEVIRKAWKKAGIDPRTITYIEAHGSGTKLGDPIEIAGIDQAFKGLDAQRHSCAVSSVKSNIGHTGSAAGIAGLIKAILSLRYKELYPSVHFDRPNPFIDFANSITYINTSYTSWQAPFPRRAGVSSFGLSGTNCHVVLEEAPQPAKSDIPKSDITKGNITIGDIPKNALISAQKAGGPWLFNFSAMTATSLKSYLEDFQEFLTWQLSDSILPDMTLPNISYTLNLGRRHMPCRTSVIAASPEELMEKLGNSPLVRISRPPEKIIFLFSGDSPVSDQLITTICTAHPAIKKFMEECSPHRIGSNTNSNRFMLQYALYRFLEEAGITTDSLLGIGNGDWAIAAILNELSLTDAMESSANLSEIPVAGLDSRCMGLVERETADCNVVFVEMGPPGILSKSLRELNYPDKDAVYAVVSMENDPLEILQGLFLQQYPVNWSRFYDHSSAHKVSLPVYRFDKIRCWLKEPGASASTAMHPTDSLSPHGDHFSPYSERATPLAEHAITHGESVSPYVVHVSPHTAPHSGSPGQLPAPGATIPTPRPAEAIIPASWPTETIIPPSWSAMEKEIAAIWIGVLRLDQLSLDDDFFRLGGHSLLATRVITQIEHRFGIKLVFKDIFTFATVRSLAKGVENLIADKPAHTRDNEIRPVAQQHTALLHSAKSSHMAQYPLSEAQRRLWLIAQANPASIAYNLPSTFWLEGQLDIDRLEWAINRLIENHESLRTSFHETNGQPVQQIHQHVQFSIERITSEKPESALKTEPDLALQPGSGPEPEEAELAQAAALIKRFVRPFDLTQAPLLRITLVTVSERKYLFLLDMHHIISDGVSLGLFTTGLTDLYNGKELAPPAIQYKDYTAWLQEQGNNGSLLQQERYWLDQFYAIPPALRLPTDRPRSANGSTKGDFLPFEIDGKQISKIHSLASQTGTTPFMILLAVLNTLLHKLTGQEDMCIGTAIAGRDHHNLENIIGMFVNTLVMRNRPEKHKTFLQLLAETKECALNAYENQGYPFALLVDKLDLPAGNARNPLFDVMFSYQNIEMKEMQLDGLRVTSCPLETGVSPFDLILEIYDGGNKGEETGKEGAQENQEKKQGGKERAEESKEGGEGSKEGAEGNKDGVEGRKNAAQGPKGAMEKGRDAMQGTQDKADGWPARWIYNSSLFDKDTVLLIKERYLALLDEILASPDNKLEALSARIAIENNDMAAGLDVSFNF